MYRLYGVPTQNTLKVAYVLDALGVNYEYQFVNLAKGEQKTEAFLKMNPVGKVPTLKHNDFSVFESNTICRYVASAEKSSLYPQDLIKRTATDQWLDFFSNHLGRWLSTMFFEKCLKAQMGMGEANPAKYEEALNFVNQQIVPVEKKLSDSKFISGNDITIADYVAYAYLDQTRPLAFDLSKYPNINKWLLKMDTLDSIKISKGKVKF